VRIVHGGWERLGFVLLACLVAPAPASAAVDLERVGTFKQPVDVGAPPGDRSGVFVAERGGRIRVLRGGRIRTFADLRGRVEIRDRRNIARDQGGLLSVAYGRGRAYVLYTGRDDLVHVDALRRGRLRTLLTVPRRSSNDLGGQLRIGPDGMLWVSLGYGADREASQDLARLEGKLLRIDPRRDGSYGIPPGNPGLPGARPEIYAYGLRNPWRFAFQGRRLIVADVGESRQEEIDVVPWRMAAGADFGWPRFEGRARLADGPRGVRPVFVRRHRSRVCAIIGGHVARGRFLYGDLCGGEVRSVALGSGRARGDRSEGASVPFLSSFGTDARGRSYAASLYGPLYRLTLR